MIEVPAKKAQLGYEAACPICHKVNRAVVTKDRGLIWWPNDTTGVWCIHSTGCYVTREDNHIKVLFYFREAFR